MDSGKDIFMAKNVLTPSKKGESFYEYEYFDTTEAKKREDFKKRRKENLEYKKKEKKNKKPES